MKRVCTIICSFLLMATASAQSNLSLLQLIQEIEERYNVSFSYNHRMASQTRVDRPQFGNNIAQVLTIALQGSGVGYLLEGSSVSLYPDKKNVNKPVKQSFSGRVRDKNGGETLPNALIQVVDDNKFTISNRDGLFSIVGRHSDSTLIKVSYIGYSPFETTIGELKEIKEINLEANPEVLEEVLISDQLEIFEIPERPGQITLNARYLDNLTSFGERDAFRSLQLLPGINGTSESSANLRVRGGTPDQNLVLFDGFTVYHLDHFFGVFSAFNSQVIKDIQVYKGGFGAEYGGRVSGVIDMIGKNGNRDRVSGQATVNLLSASAAIEVPVSKDLSFVVAGRRSFTDFIQTNLFSNLFDQVNDETDIGQVLEEDENIDPDFRFYDLNAKASWNVTENDLINLSFYRGQDRLIISQLFEDSGADFLFEQAFRQQDEWGNQGESFRYARKWSDRLYTDFVFSHADFTRDKFFAEETLFLDSAELVEEEFDFSDQNKIEDFTLNLSNDYTLNANHTLKLGGFFNRTSISYSSVFNGEDDFGFDQSSNLFGAFLNHQFLPVEGLQLNSGLRYTYYQLIEENYLEPRASISYQLNPIIRLKGSYGKHFQFVGRVATFDNSFGQEDFWLQRGNEDSPVIESDQFIAGFNLDLGPIEVDVEGYYKRLDGLSTFQIDIENESDEDRGDLVQGTGKIRGIDFLVKHESNNLTSWISYTLSESTNQFDGIQDDEFFPSNFDQLHELKLVSSYQLKSWNFTGSWIYGSGTPYTERFFNLDSQENFPVGSVNSERLPDYHRLDLNISYLRELKKIDLRIFLNLINIYNRSNVRNIFNLEQFDEEEDEFVNRDVAIEMLGITPSLGVEVRF